MDALDDGRRVAVATVTRVLGSAPRTLGTSMAVDEAGVVIGSISGGCVEGAVYDLSETVLHDGRAALTEFGVSDTDAFAVGLSCGGQLEVFVAELAPPGQRNALNPAVRAELEAARRGEPAALAIVVAGPGVGHIVPLGAERRRVGRAAVAARGATTEATDSTGEPDRETLRRIRSELRSRMAAGSTATETIECNGATSRVLYLVSAAPARFIVFGAVDFSAAVADAASLLGYRVTVCDARAVFATAARFPSAHDVVVEWPSQYLARTEVDVRTVICVLTHDERFDIPLLTLALRMPVGYVGAMGSRRTHDKRMRSLTEAGLTADELGRLHSPIGLDVGACTPQETAVSILAEVLAARTGASGAALRGLAGPIHATV
nr:XdhC/CoxI family protein [Cryobacterium roopkundense]